MMRFRSIRAANKALLNRLGNLNPELIIKEMDETEFLNWLENGTIKDLEECLKVFETYELYEHCEIIKNLIETTREGW